MRVWKETPKAVCLEKNSGAKAWFPKSVLEEDDEIPGHYWVKEWFVRRGLTKEQAELLRSED